MNFIEIINCIFLNKSKYSIITDEDKEKNFFIINRKFSRKYPEIAFLFNNKNIDKSTSLDMWFFYFKDIHRIPQWYWGNKNIKKQKKLKILGNEIIDRENLNKNDLIFLNKYFNKELKNEIKKIKKYE